MPLSHRLSSTLAFLFLLLAGCTARSAPETTSPTSPTQTPVYELSFPLEAELAPSTTAGELLVIGVARTKTEAVEDPHVAIVLRDGSGAEIARRTIEIPLDALPSNSAWPFRELFRPDGAAASVEAALVGNAGEARGLTIDGRILRTFLDAEGRTVALGSLSNRGTTSAFVERLGLLGRDGTGAMREVIDGMPASTRLGLDDEVPFLALLPRGSEDLEWEVSPIGRASSEPALQVEILEEHSYQDDQGNPFVAAVVRNRSSEPVWLVLTGIVREGETWLVAAYFSLPLPLAPGERASFSLRVPGAGIPDAAAVDWLIVPGSRPAESGPVGVSTEVIGYQPAGSTLFLRVRLTAGAETALLYPSAQATITDDEGMLMSAGWSTGPDALAPAETTVVTLALPLPSGFDLTLGQLGVLGAALPADSAGP